VDSAANSKTKIGLIGLGLMGQPIGMNLVKAGYPLTVWNRTTSRANELVGMGATLAMSPKDVAAASDVLITICQRPPALESVLWGADGKDSGALAALRPGSTYIDSSTVSPALARKIAAACAERKVHFLDAPVTGGDWGAKKGELIFMVGGDAETLKSVELVLSVLGKRWFHLGPNGAGQTIKLAHEPDSGAAGRRAGRSAGAGHWRRAERRGPSGSDANRAWRVPGVLDVKAPNLLKGEYKPSFPLRLMHKDLSLSARSGESDRRGLARDRSRA